jgi:sortase (surface protein transpeptidase)
MGVDAGFVRLRSSAGQQSIPLPSPVAKAGWYDGSVAPGSPGTSILVGFIAGRGAVFARLADLHRGDVVSVRRKDNRSAAYVVDSIRGYRPGTLPTSIYAGTGRPLLRLISCGGALRPGQPAENVVVTAHLQRITA